MSYVIVGTCIKDGACVDVCPVDCIHPGPGEADHDAADMLFIDPAVCVRCNACAEICPVDAIMPAEDLPLHLKRYAAINAALALGEIR
jgi:ferredoxin